MKIAYQDNDFDLIVDSRWTIEYLGTVIEAEYTHRFVIPVMSEDGESTVDPLACGALYDSEKNLLRFSEHIASVLDVNAEVLVINTNHGMHLGTLFNTAVKGRSNADDKGGSLMGELNKQRADELLQRIFRNKIALDIFHDFCVGI